MRSPAETLKQLPPGTRVVVRYTIPGGLTDALGILTGVDGGRCTVATRAGDVAVELSRVVAAKEVPPPPARRGRALT